MERNTLLAIVLSALVLFTYQAIFVAPKQAETAINSQVNIVQNISAKSTPLPIMSSNNVTQPTTVVNKPADYIFKTPEANISFTNVGGSLHIIDFLGNNEFPVTDILNIGNLENAQYTGQKLDNKTLSLVYTDKDFQILKTYEINDNNAMKVRMEIKNISKISILNVLHITAFKIDNSRMDINSASKNSRETALYEYSIYANNKISRHGNAYKFNDKNNKSEAARVNWVGFRDHYNAFVVKPEFETKGYEIKADSDQQLNVILY